MKNKKTAIVIGATGLIGKQLVKLLINDSAFYKIKVFVRRESGVSNPKIEEHIIDFNELASSKDEIKGDILFSTLGTTIKQAGSKEKQYLVDFTYQYEIAKIASENGVKNYTLVSSSGANSKSKIFYSRMKGELDDAIKELSFSKIRIFKPSLLMGQREEKRMGEKIGEKVLKVVTIIPFLKKYKAIKGKEVAQAMINIENDSNESPILTYELDEIFKLI